MKKQKTQVIKDNSDPKKDCENIIKYNAKLLDCLYRLTFHNLNKDQFAFLESQLRKTPKHICYYLYRLSKYVTKKKKTK